MGPAARPSPGCTPPVHGSICLIACDPETGEIYERRGALYAEEGGGTFSRLLQWRKRSQLQAAQAQQAVPQRSPAWQVAGAVTAAMRTPKPKDRAARSARWSQPAAAESERASVRQTLAQGYEE